MQDLRRLIAEDATFGVVKNTLARRAAEAAKRDEMLDYLQGPTGIVWVSGDPAFSVSRFPVWHLLTSELAHGDKRRAAESFTIANH